jgi:hypothetical protein
MTGPSIGRGVTGAVDALMFLGILIFSAAAFFAIALGAPLAIAASAIAAVFSRGAVKGGWRVVRAA